MWNITPFRYLPNLLLSWKFSFKCIPMRQPQKYVHAKWLTIFMHDAWWISSELLIFGCDETPQKWVCLSVCLSVHLSVRFAFSYMLGRGFLASLLASISPCSRMSCCPNKLIQKKKVALNNLQIIEYNSFIISHWSHRFCFIWWFLVIPPKAVLPLSFARPNPCCMHVIY